MAKLLSGVAAFGVKPTSVVAKSGNATERVNDTKRKQSVIIKHYKTL